MELESLIKSISEFGVLIVIAAIYLVQNLRDSSSFKKDFVELKDAVGKLATDNLEANHNILHHYELSEYIEIFLKAFKADLLSEVLAVISHNNIHSDEDILRKNFRIKVEVLKDKCDDFLEEKSCNGHALPDIIKGLDLDVVSETCLSFIYSEPKDRKVISLVRQLDTILDAFKATV